MNSIRRWPRLLSPCIAFLGTLTPAAAADWKLDCPRELPTAQVVSGEVPDGWSAVARTTSAIRDAAPGAPVIATSPPVSISVFDGPPSEMADLVPDNPNAKVQRWTFGRKRTRDVYIVCNYADTRIKLARKAPAEVTSCATSTPSGAITGVVCK
ncbi:MAG: STY0301 family protein [Burkholderiales bacterium]